MRARLASLCACLFLTVAALAQQSAPKQTSPTSPAATDWSVIEKRLGRAPSEQHGIHKVVFWRTDIPAYVGTTRVAPAAALGSWAAFRESENGVVADGDLVLLSREVPGVMDALQKHGFEVTALHNHLIGERPEVMYMHFFARGEIGAIANGLRSALDSTRTPMTAADAKPPQGPITYDQKAIEGIIGKAGTPTGPVLGFSFPRANEITMHGNMLPPAMGMATAINFQPSRQGVAATGDFVLKEVEVTPVLVALRKGGVAVTAIHNHLMDENPRMVFVHFWAEGKSEDVARALRNALDQVH